MTITKEQTEELRKICPDVYFRDQDGFEDKAAPWSLWADRKPQIAVEPKDTETLQAVVKFLYKNKEIDFCVRNTGTGGSSATDVVLSMHGFKELDFDSKDETFIAGAGLSWGEVDVLMEEKAIGFGATGARCTWVGVAGGTLVGGLSWLSHEYGMISDPQNWLDAQVVLSDGRVVWAAKEMPDLMWALRGGGGNFGVVTRLKFKARKVPNKAFIGVITVPYSSLEEVSKATAAFNRRPGDPKTALMVMNQGPGAGMADQGAKPGIIIMPVDFRGEAHARSEEGFAWAWQVTGAEEFVAMETSLRGVNALNDTFKSYQGTNKFWLCAPFASDIDDQLVVRMWKWYEESINLHPSFGVGSTVLLEFMQKPAFDSTSGPEATAWPHGKGQRHVLQLVLGCRPEEHPADGSDIRTLVMKQFAKAGKEMGREHFHGEYHAGFLNEWNDLEQVYGGNYKKLKKIKKKYDSENRFNKGVDLTEGRITPGMTV